MSHSNAKSSSSLVLEQRNLLGGTDLMPVLGRGNRKRARRFHVASDKRLGFAAALALVVEHGKQLAKETGVTSMSQCPRCSHMGPTESDFGYRIIRGERRPQSWCRSCRGQPPPPSEAHSTSNTAPRVEEGWLFPPDSTSGTRPPRKGKRTAT